MKKKPSNDIKGLQRANGEVDRGGGIFPVLSKMKQVRLDLIPGQNQRSFPEVAGDSLHEKASGEIFSTFPFLSKTFRKFLCI